MEAFRIPAPVLRVENGGLFVSKPGGSHSRRRLLTYELIFVRSGILRMKEKDRRWEIGSGETLVLEPGYVHEGIGEYPADLSFYWIHFRISSRLGQGKIAIPKHGKIQRPERMSELFHRFLDDQETGVQTPEEAAATVMGMLLEARRRGAPLRSEGSRSLAGRVRAHIVSHFSESISTAQIAADFRVNSDYLGRVFNSTYGISIVEAIHQERIREARVLLRESPLNIEEVGLSVGFQDASHFRRLFRRAQGISPRSYRQLYSRLHINRR